MKNVTILGVNPSISSVTYETDKNDVPYAVVKLQSGGKIEKFLNAFGQIDYKFDQPVTTTVTAYSQSYVREGADPLYSLIEQAKTINIPLSEIKVTGTIVKIENLEPYEIDGNLVNSDKLIVFGQLTEGSLMAAMKQRNKQFADVVSETTETRVVERREIAPSI